MQAELNSFVVSLCCICGAFASLYTDVSAHKAGNFFPPYIPLLPTFHETFPLSSHFSLFLRPALRKLLLLPPPSASSAHRLRSYSLLTRNDKRCDRNKHVVLNLFSEAYWVQRLAAGVLRRRCDSGSCLWRAEWNTSGGEVREREKRNSEFDNEIDTFLK